MGYIYMLKNKINEKIYIGQTIRNVEKRLEEHRKKSRCIAIYNAIQIHGWENFEQDWYECPDEDLNFDEDFLVREMGTLAPDGYNIREGGGSRGKHSEESRNKMRKPKSETHAKNISEATKGEKNHNFGKKADDKTREKLSEAKKGEKNHMWRKSHTDESNQKNREAHLGKTSSDETKQKLSDATKGENNPMAKRVYQYDLAGTFINSFGTSEEAGLYLKKRGATISRCARGDRKTAYGFKWSHKKI